MATGPSPSVFFAYASHPTSCGETMTTAAAELAHAGLRGLTWQELHPGGRVLIDVITAAIDGSDSVVAEISTMNRNVLFEAGYALARDKELLFAIDESLESARRLWDGFNSSPRSAGWTTTGTVTTSRDLCVIV